METIVLIGAGAVGALQTIFLICAAAGGTLLVLQFVMSVLGLGGEDVDLDLRPTGGRLEHHSCEPNRYQQQISQVVQSFSLSVGCVTMSSQLIDSPRSVLR